MRMERHVFGSYSGYATLARSPGLGADEVRQLEASSFAFGQTSDRGYLKGLKRSPAWFTRALRGGRRGLTRVLEGAPDDNGRPTLLMVTALVSQREWDAELCGDVALLLDDPAVWEWSGGQDLPAVEKVYPLPSRGVPRKSVPKLLALLSELERRLPARQPVVVSAADFSSDDLRAVEVLVPPSARGHFTCACRSLSVNLPVSVNCLATEADSQAVTFRPRPDVPRSPYATFLESTAFAGGALPLGDVMEYRTFGRRGAAAAPGSPGSPAAPPDLPPVTVVTRTPKAVVVVLLLLSLLTAGAGFAAGWALAKARAEREGHPSRRAGSAGAVAAATPATAPSTNSNETQPSEGRSDGHSSQGAAQSIVRGEAGADASEPSTSSTKASGGADGGTDAEKVKRLVAELAEARRKAGEASDGLRKHQQELEEVRRNKQDQDGQILKLTDSLARARREGDDVLYSAIRYLLEKVHNWDELVESRELLAQLDSALAARGGGSTLATDSSKDSKWLESKRDVIRRMKEASAHAYRLKRDVRRSQQIIQGRAQDEAERNKWYDEMSAISHDMDEDLDGLSALSPALKETKLKEQTPEQEWAKQRKYVGEWLKMSEHKPTTQPAATTRSTAPASSAPTGGKAHK